MKQHAVIRSVIAFAIITMTGTAFAQDATEKSSMHMKPKGYIHQAAHDGIKLTDEQRDRLKSLRQSFIDETATSRAAIAAKREEIRILMETTSPDRTKITALSSELGKLQQEIMIKEIDLAIEARKIAPGIKWPIASLGMARHHGMMGDRAMGAKGMGMGMMMCDKGMMAEMGNHSMGFHKRLQLPPAEDAPQATDNADEKSI